MDTDSIKTIVIDTLEARFEAYAQSQIQLHNEYHKKLLAAVESQIKTTVNGKIDKIQTTLDKLDSRIQPFEYTRGWFISFKDGIVWIAGFITPIAIIGGVLVWIYKIFK